MGVKTVGASLAVAVVVGMMVGVAGAGGDTPTVVSASAAKKNAAPAAAPATPPVPAPGTDCVTTGKGGGPRLDPDQVVNAKAIIAAANRAGVGEAGARIGVATALVEGAYTKGEKGGPVSGLRNVPYGDRDSLGLFQQRPSQGWGTRDRIMDPAKSADSFFAALKGIKGWQKMDPGAAAQRVQRSAYPARYGKRMSEAAAIVAAQGGGATGCVQAKPPAGAPANVAPAIAWAASKNGKPYIWGGTGPKGWDCSGLTLRAFEKVGVKLPRTAEMQRSWLANGHGTRVQPGQERPGDLIFSGRPATHVVMVYNTKTTKTIEALQTCRAKHRGPGIDCGVGHWDYSRRIARGGQIWRVNQ